MNASIKCRTVILDRVISAYSAEFLDSLRISPADVGNALSRYLKSNPFTNYLEFKLGNQFDWQRAYNSDCDPDDGNPFVEDRINPTDNSIFNVITMFMRNVTQDDLPMPITLLMSLSDAVLADPEIASRAKQVNEFLDFKSKMYRNIAAINKANKGEN